MGIRFSWPPWNLVAETWKASMLSEHPRDCEFRNESSRPSHGTVGVGRWSVVSYHNGFYCQTPAISPKANHNTNRFRSRAEESLVKCFSTSSELLTVIRRHLPRLFQSRSKKFSAFFSRPSRHFACSTRTPDRNEEVLGGSTRLS